MIMRTKFSRRSVPTQTIGNIGLYYICYWLSLFGWNVLPTSRNTKGIDVIIFSQNGSRKISIQVKTLSKRNPVPLGNNLNFLVSDYVIICVRDYPNDPDCYILTSDEVRQLAHRGEKNGKISYWLQRPNYEKELYKGKWEKIGHGVP